MNIRSAILTAALGAALLATPVLAETPNASIRTSDLNLATPAGQEQLDRRIDAAARTMCGISDIRTGTILQGNKQKQCFEHARVTAHQQVAAQLAHNDAAGG